MSTLPLHSRIEVTSEVEVRYLKLSEVELTVLKKAEITCRLLYAYLTRGVLPKVSIQ